MDINNYYLALTLFDNLNVHIRVGNLPIFSHLGQKYHYYKNANYSKLQITFVLNSKYIYKAKFVLNPLKNIQCKLQIFGTNFSNDI
jgi:hypothetical protein